MPQNCLLASALITFLSRESSTVRRDIINTWSTEIDIKVFFDFKDFFCTEQDQLNWELEGLPMNKSCIENIIIMEKVLTIPVLIDSTSTILPWLTNHLNRSKQQFEHINFNSTKFNTILEASVRFGKILIIQEIEKEFFTLLSLLRNDVVYEGERRMIYLFGKKIDYNVNFRMIIVTNDDQVFIPAEIEPYITILEFEINESDFTDQLLSAAIKQEKPELDLKRKKILQNNEKMQEKLDVSQNKLLEYLSTSDSNILDNKDLCITLDETKANSNDVRNGIVEFRSLQTELRKESDNFLDISNFASKYYIASKEFSEYNNLYAWSVQYFKKLFLLCLKSTQIFDESSTKPKMFQFFFEQMSIGIFENDKLPFLFHMVHRMFPTHIPTNEMNVFLGESGYCETEVNENNFERDFSWLPSKCLEKVKFLQQCLPDVIDKCKLKDRSIWQEYIESSYERSSPLYNHLSEFQKLLIVQALKPENLMEAIEYTLLKITGFRTLKVSNPGLRDSLKNSNASEPILLITSPGVDPSHDIRVLANQLDMRFEEISMSEEQQQTALDYLHKCQKDGKWLLLKNTHLVVHWLPVIHQKLTDKSNENEFSDKFRLWLIAETVLEFNSTLIKYCLKIVYEEPQGVANTMKKNYLSLGGEYDNKISSATSARIFFIFNFLHALLQERRKYIPQGWTKYYEFNYSDINTSLCLTENLWNADTSRVQWNYIKGLTFDAVYYGRIENVEDANILQSYADLYLNNKVLSYNFSPPGLRINLPNGRQNKEYLNVINTMPPDDDPAIFGLSANINKALKLQITSKLISVLKGFYKNQHETGINTTNLHYSQMWRELMKNYNSINKVDEKTTFGSSVELLIQEEHIFGMDLIKYIDKCLINITARIVQNEADFQMVKYLSEYSTPPAWLSVWNGPRDPAKYLHSISENIKYITSLKQNSNPEQSIELSNFFHPEAFLASLKQDHSRSMAYPLETIILQVGQSNLGNDFFLRNILIEGALYENGRLMPCSADSDSFQAIESFHCNWITKDEYPNSKWIKVPLYSDLNRNYKIIDLYVCCNDNEEAKWTLSGVAFYTEF